MKMIYPSIGILSRLNLKVEQQLGMETEEQSIEDLVSLATKLPSFAIYELWDNFHIGTNLDDYRQSWLVDRIHRHGFNHLESEARRLYMILDDLKDKT